MPNINKLLLEALYQKVDRLDAQMLLLHVLKRNIHDRSWLYVHEDMVINESQYVAFKGLQQQWLAGTPLAYLVGQVSFYGLILKVNESVLIPRSDTETIVTWALELIAEYQLGLVVDLGCGSGAIALAIKANVKNKDMHVLAIDQSAAAITVAKENARQLNLDIHFKQGNWLQGNQEKFDLIVSNPPYIAENDPHLPDLQDEPISALVSGEDGLQDLRLIIQSSCHHLKQGGYLLLEHGYNQAQQVGNLLTLTGFSEVMTRRDFVGHTRVTGCKWVN